MSDSSHPWYREPMVWLVWGLPFCVVLAGFATLAIAIRTGGNDASADPVHRMAQVQTTDLNADRHAQERGLAASLRLTGERLELQLIGGGKHERELTLHLSHPADAKADHELTLHAEGDRWTATVSLPAAVHWNVSLRPADGSWRLDGELDSASGIAILRPRFADG